MKGLPNPSLGGLVLGEDGEAEGRERVAAGMRWAMVRDVFVGDGECVRQRVATGSNGDGDGDGNGGDDGLSAVDSLSDALDAGCETGSVGGWVGERVECVSCAAVCPWSPEQWVASRTLSTEEKTG